ncbi:hypothetical protein ACTXGU_11395 [Niallia sp. 01092]|uniref:hypothetical protein n=1 Tax=Niallia sp. 01092 TaxID=3457759 RepID=UPI003FD61F98
MCETCGGSRVIHSIDSFSVRTSPCPICPPETVEERNNRLESLYQALAKYEMKMVKEHA